MISAVRDTLYQQMRVNSALGQVDLSQVRLCHLDLVISSWSNNSLHIQLGCQYHSGWCVFYKKNVNKSLREY